MKNMIKWNPWIHAAALLLTAQAAWSQNILTAESSQTLTEIRKMGDCTVYTFNYPSVSATGKPTVLSSALFAWTPADRQPTDSIESLHIFSHITITSDDERLTTTAELSKEQNLLLFLPGRQYASFMGGEQADYVGRCIVIAPDYEGYGVTKDVPHPYLSQRVTARQMVDGVKYGLELYQKVAQTSETLLPMKSDTFSTSDHMDAGLAFLMDMMSMKNYGAYFNWLCEGTTTGIRPTPDYTDYTDKADVWYDLSGRRIVNVTSSNGKLPKGIYLNRGRKVIVK